MARHVDDTRPEYSSNGLPGSASERTRSTALHKDGYQQAKVDHTEILSGREGGTEAWPVSPEAENRVEAKREENEGEQARKRMRRSSGRACVYCRRSPLNSKPQPQLPASLYSDPGFPPAWPLLPDSAGPVTYGGVTEEISDLAGEESMRNGAWGRTDDSELGALTKFLGDQGDPLLPVDFLDALSYFGRGGGIDQSEVPFQGFAVPRNGVPPALDGAVSMHQFEASASEIKGKAKQGSMAPPPLASSSRIERYFLAAADQPSGPRASRLAQVIKAKYDAGLLKPYDYIKGYERMNKWMESGRAAPKADSPSESTPSSPQKGAVQSGRSRMLSATPVPVSGSSISPESRRRILAALNGFRPKFRQIARTLTDVDLVFVEEAMERWMLEYDRAFASIHTPSCIWRRTGEIQKANQEFANLTGIPASLFRNGLLCVYELMDEDSAKPSAPSSTAVKSVAAVSRASVPDLALPQSLVTGRGGWSDAASPETDHPGMISEEYREIECCFSVTIRRDAWGVPVAIMGQWINFSWVLNTAMARDPPSLVASSELRDLSLQPSAVKPTEITIIHQQLRDLILPLERGKVLYPRGTAIEQLCWSPEIDEDGSSGPSSTATTSFRAKLLFTPNCLTASDQLLACGGQHGELYITNRSDSATSARSRLNARFTSSATPMKQFSLCLTLPTRSINNSLVILPGWPEEWSRHEEERRLGFLGQGSRQWDEGARADDLEEENDEDEDEEDELSDGMREDTDALMHEDELAEDEEYSAPTSASSRSGTGSDAVGLNGGLAAVERSHDAIRWDLDRARQEREILLQHRQVLNRMLVRERQGLDMERAELDEFERVIGLSIRPRPSSSASSARPREGPSCPPVMPTPQKQEMREERKLTKVGGARFKYAINHSSLSPDLKTMVSVGDSTDVYLFEVVNGGREFKRIGIYNAATDSGFSTAWSKDGRKFAVASQDGQVTVWDHRSSRPFAIFHTSSTHSVPLSPSFTSREDLRFARVDTDSDGGESDREGYPSLIDPVTGDLRMGSSTSGKEAARVVKFSPEGSSRDLMVFSEENSNIHIVDARTFHTHVIVPVPHASYPSARELTGRQEMGENWGIAGVAFDPTGEWLYSGTENTVVEWDLRRVGGGEGGTWRMA
ncbi:MAG: hypothetical protein TREMPRED_002944 [Tremellales sp. Tagirdzhanova-0007]|nr:MAG: hypothetical protein TREMPRED_002944 [Tremellales sp. Tagirdzhanova-0007]